MPSLDEHRERLTRNTAYLTAAFVVQKVVSSLYFLLYANLVGPSVAGAYLFAFSFASLFSILADVGLSPLIIRDVARQPSQAAGLFRSAVRLKLWTTLGAGAVIAVIAPRFIEPGLRLQLLVFTTAFILLESFSLTAYGVLRGLQRLRFEAVGSTIAQLVPLALGGGGLLLTRQPIWLGIGLVAGSLINLLYAMVQLRRALGPSPRPAEPGLAWAGRTIAPFFLSGVLARLYAYLDVVLVGVLASDRVVGLYATAYRLTYSLQFLPQAFNTSLYPALSQAFQEARLTLTTLVERSLRLLMTLSLPLAVLLALHARPILSAFFPDFTDASLAVQLSVASLPFLFVNFLLSSLLNATNQQTRLTWILAAVVAVNVLLNLWLIPRLAQVGASLAALVATACFTLLSLLPLAPYVRLTRASGWFACRLLVAVGLTALLSLALVRELPIIVVLLVDGWVFIGLNLLLKTWTFTEFRSVLRVFRLRRL